MTNDKSSFLKARSDLILLETNIRFRSIQVYGDSIRHFLSINSDEFEEFGISDRLMAIFELARVGRLSVRAHPVAHGFVWNMRVSSRLETESATLAASDPHRKPETYRLVARSDGTLDIYGQPFP